MNHQLYDSEVLTKAADLARVTREWNALAEQFGTPLLEGDWFTACAETLCDESDLCVVIVRLKGTIHAVAPLVIVRRGGVEWLEILGVSKLYEPAGFLYHDMEALKHVVDRVVSLGRPMMLARIPAESPLRSVLRRSARFKYIAMHVGTAPAAYVRSAENWEGFFCSISSQRRYDYQRKRKRLGQAGEVAVRVESPGSSDALSHLLEEVCRIEGAGWKGRAGSALQSNDPVRNFITRYCEMACVRGIVRMCFLSVRGLPVATILGIEHSRRFWVLKIGYDEQWARCSPGIQITMETIRYAFEQGLEAYEFLGSEEPWQAMWPLDRHNFVTLVLYPIARNGLRAFCGDCLRVLRNRMTRARAAAGLARRSCQNVS